MADLSITQGDCLDPSVDDTDEGVFEQGDGPSACPADEILPPLLRVQKYADSDQAYDRQMVPRVIQAIFRSARPEQLAEDLTYLMQLITRISEEDDVTVRIDLLEQIPTLATIALESSTRVPALVNIVPDHLLPLVVRNLNTVDYQVLKTVQFTLISLMEKGLVTKIQAEIQVCPTILSLSRRQSEKDCVMDFQTGAVTLMSKMAPLLGRDVMERVFLERFTELCKHSAFNTRKVCASHFSDFCAVVGKDVYEKVLLPAYVILAADENWGVRKSCTEVAVPMSCVCPPAARRSILAPLFARLLRDISRWVRNTAFQVLGPFIATFAQPSTMSLAYNTMGELVLLNQNGSQFELRSVVPLADGNAGDVTSDPNAPDFVSITQRLGLDLTDLTYDTDSDSDSADNDQFYDNYDENFEKLTAARDVGGHMFQQSQQGQGLLQQQLLQEQGQGLLQQQQQLQPGELQQSQQLGLKEQQLQENTVNSQLLTTADSSSSSKTEETSLTSETCDNSKTNIVATTLLSSNKTTEGAADLPPTSSNSSHLDPTTSSTTSSTLPDVLCNLSKLSLAGIIGGGVGGAGGGVGGARGGVNTGDSIKNELPTSSGSSASASHGTDVVTSASRRSTSADMYNSYYYWYVSPDMPLDPDIVDAGRPLDDVVAQATPSSVAYASPRHLAGENQCYDIYNYKADLDCGFNTTFDLSTCTFKDGGENTTTTIPIFGTDDTDDIDDPNTSQHIVPHVLIKHYTAMADPALQVSTNPDIAYYCAYALPAVVLTLGAEHWDLLRGTVEALAGNQYYKVRRTVAGSLHELAVILGREIASEHLTVIFDGFIKDLDEVRIGILQHLSHFLMVISPAKRRVYLERFHEFLRIDNELNWRFQQQLSLQLRLAIPLYKPVDVFRHISFIAIILLRDNIAVARKMAMLLVTEMLKYGQKERNWASRVLIKLAEGFAHSKMWKLRQTFALLSADILRCEALPLDQFSAEMMPHLLDLSWDPVAVVRLVVARTISQQVVTKEYFNDPSNNRYTCIHTALRRLLSDKDKDVRDFATLRE